MICATFQVIVGNFLLCLKSGQLVLRVTTNIANGNFMLIQFLVEGFDHFTTTRLVERGNSKANYLTIVVRIDTQVGSLNGFFYLNQKFAIQRLITNKRRS